MVPKSSPDVQAAIQALATFNQTLYAMKAVAGLAEHAKNHDDLSSNMAHLLDMFITPLSHAYCTLAEFQEDVAEGGAA